MTALVRFGEALDRIQGHARSALPGFRQARPALRVGTACLTVYFSPLAQNRPILAGMALLRCYVVKRTMEVFEVVPVDEFVDPVAGVGGIDEGSPRIVGPVFQRAE